LNLERFRIPWQTPQGATQDSTANRGPRSGRFYSGSRWQGIHHKFKHEKFSGSVILSGKEGDDARRYQEKQVSNAIREATK